MATILMMVISGCGDSNETKKETSVYCGLFTKQLIEDLVGHDQISVADEEVSSEAVTCTVYDDKTGRVLIGLTAVPKIDEKTDVAEAKGWVDFNQGKPLAVPALAEVGAGGASTAEITLADGTKQPAVSAGVVMKTHVAKIMYRPVEGRYGTTAEDVVEIAKDLDANLAKLPASAEAADSNSQESPSTTGDSPGADVVVTASDLSSRLG
jgi:hypothetical protein